MSRKEVGPGVTLLGGGRSGSRLIKLIAPTCSQSAAINNQASDPPRPRRHLGPLLVTADTRGHLETQGGTGDIMKQSSCALILYMCAACREGDGRNAAAARCTSKIYRVFSKTRKGHFPFFLCLFLLLLFSL